MKQFKYYWQVAMLAFTVFLSLPINAGLHYTGAYSLEQGNAIFNGDCNKFRSQFSANVGPHSYVNNQYYYGYNYLFQGSNDYFVDFVDLAFVAGHGNQFSFDSMNGGTSFYNTGNGWGDQYLKWIGFFTCQTIMIPSKNANAWTAYRNTAKGVHLMCGFHEDSALAATNLPDKWASYMIQGDYVWYAWFRAINSARNYYGSVYAGGWPGKGSVVLFTDQYGNAAKDPYYDRLSSYCAKPTANASVNFLYQY